MSTKQESECRHNTQRWESCHRKRRGKRSKGTLYFIVLGVVSIVWLLLRVIPKPSRITYPCQRMAAANATVFITWLLGTVIATTFFRKALRRLQESRVTLAVVLIFLSLAVGSGTLLLTSSKDITAAVKRQSNEVFTPPEPLNQPMGIAKGIHPGRVSWAFDPDAVSYDPSAGNGFWWEDQNTDPERVDRMFSLSLDAVSGASTAYDGWDRLFRDANIRKGTGDMGYAPGEKIAIKANLLVGLGGGKEKANSPGPSPQLLMSMITDLVEEVGVPGDMITVYDVSARIPDYIMDPFKNHSGEEYRKVRFVGNPRYLEGEETGRYIAAVGDLESKIHFADSTVTDIFWVKSLTESDYLINLTNMKGHTMAGVTVCAKNLYGSIYIPTATLEFWPDGNYLWGFGPNNVTDSLGNPDPHRGLHKCVTVHDFYDNNIGSLPAREYGSYNYLVDILGHPQIRDKTILNIVDALYGSDQQNRIVKYDSFGDEYCASIFMSQDVIALESVCVDFLRSEPKNSLNVHGNVDNWLHESSRADAPPSGLVYNPGKEDSPLESLGVHEHWNSWEKKEYSRNLETGDGIELYTVDFTVGFENRGEKGYWCSLNSNYPNPFGMATTISYSIETESRIKIEIYDRVGRKVETLVDGVFPAGKHRVDWDASGIPAGLYICRMSTERGYEGSLQLVKTGN